jgi:pimeloyl-ACP methyl ester carboxylesterase
LILHAEIAGHGAPVVLLHGLFGRARNLAVVARGLSASHRVISLDLRNHGASPHAAGMDYQVLAGDVLETLAGLDALPCGMLGHSMGGKTAMACALLAPARVSGLLVADIAPVAYRHGNAAIAAAMRGLALRPGMTRDEAARGLLCAVPDPVVRGFLVQNFVPGSEPGWRIGLDFIADGVSEIESWPDFAAARYDGRVLFVNGARSDYVRAADRAGIRALFPRAHFLTLKNAGHWLHADQPDAFGAVVGGFFGVWP